MFNRRNWRQFLSGLDQCEPALDFACFRETSGVVFGEQQYAVGDDIELAATALRDRDLLPAAGLQRRGQTGRAVLVASSPAVKNSGAHGISLRDGTG